MGAHASGVDVEITFAALNDVPEFVLTETLTTESVFFVSQATRTFGPSAETHGSAPPPFVTESDFQVAPWLWLTVIEDAPLLKLSDTAYTLSP